MAGIYIHIPFCKQACNYCNFHFSTSLRNKKALLDAILLEIEQCSITEGELIETIYFGGGTPSLCSPEELKLFLDKIYTKWQVNPKAEITLECNPDDMTMEYLDTVKALGVNRLSIGIQSFSDVDLLFMNRAHSSKNAFDAIENTRKAGFENFSVDLIYGSPTTTDEQWIKNIRTAIDSGAQHLSCYSLTVEEKTALGHQVKKGLVHVDENKAAHQFELLLSVISTSDFEHYEISSFCKNGMYAKHNSSYWFGQEYFGFGPAAHSYNGMERKWNISNNAKYIQAIERKEVFWEVEVLERRDIYNEYLMTGLRTKWGIDQNRIKEMGEDLYAYFLQELFTTPYRTYLVQSGDIITIEEKGKFLSDGIASDLFLLNK